jgi:isoquinoline 1-oxidoreductase beta subunit
MLGAVASAGALILGWALMPVRQRLVPAQPLALPDRSVALHGWLAIEPAGEVTVLVPKAEMGQGSHTAVAMLVAEELEADWARVRVVHAPIDAIYNNLSVASDGLPFHPDDDSFLSRAARHLVDKLMREGGFMMTGGSSTVHDLWTVARQAGASARTMLQQAAAQRWSVPAQEIQAQSGRLIHSSGRSGHYGEFAEAAAALPVPFDAPLKPPAQWRLIGSTQPQLNNATRVTGRAVYGIDVALPGLRMAAVRMCPLVGGHLVSADFARARQAPGVFHAFEVEASHGGSAGVAVVAETWWQARRALALVSVQWGAGRAAPVDDADIDARLQQALSGGPGHVFRRVGDPEAALASAATRLEAWYSVPYLAHAALEPVNCTVRICDGQADVWCGTQVPGLAREAVRRVAGRAVRSIEMHEQALGGAFGRRLEVDHVAQAALIALRGGDGHPVRTLWTREEDTTHDFYRPAAKARMRAGIDAQGRLCAWMQDSAGQSIVSGYARRALDLPAAGPDKTTAEGGFDQPYEFAAARMAHQVIEAPVPVGFWRSVGHSYQAFFKECFIDEVAHALGQDPLSLRSSLLVHHPRHLAVLKAAAALGDWATPRSASDAGARQGRGIALHASFGSIVAQVAQVRVSHDGIIRVERVACAIDCGQVVNPSAVRQQIEGAIAFGLSAALMGEVRLIRGEIAVSNFHDQPVLRMAQMPRIDIEILSSDETPQGVGEPPLPPVAAAVANAVFDATGTRLRRLPLQLARADRA